MKGWLCDRLNGATDAAIGFVVAGLLATVLFVTVVIPEVETRIIERVRSETQTIIRESGLDTELTDRIHRYFDQQGVPR